MSPIEVPIGLYPVVLVQDRYGGAYAGGRWIAVANAEEHRWRLDSVWEGAHGEEAKAFWAENRRAPWLAVGETPDAALQALIERQAEAE